MGVLKERGVFSRKEGLIRNGLDREGGGLKTAFTATDFDKITYLQTRLVCHVNTEEP